MKSDEFLALERDHPEEGGDSASRGSRHSEVNEEPHDDTPVKTHSHDPPDVEEPLKMVFRPDPLNEEHVKDRDSSEDSNVVHTTMSDDTNHKEEEMAVITTGTDAITIRSRKYRNRQVVLTPQPRKVRAVTNCAGNNNTPIQRHDQPRARAATNTKPRKICRHPATSLTQRLHTGADITKPQSSQNHLTQTTNTATIHAEDDHHRRFRRRLPLIMTQITTTDNADDEEDYQQYRSRRLLPPSTPGVNVRPVSPHDTVNAADHGVTLKPLFRSATAPNATGKPRNTNYATTTADHTGSGTNEGQRHSLLRARYTTTNERRHRYNHSTFKSEIKEKYPTAKQMTAAVAEDTELGINPTAQKNVEMGSNERENYFCPVRTNHVEPKESHHINSGTTHISKPTHHPRDGIYENSTECVARGKNSDSQINESGSPHTGYGTLVGPYVGISTATTTIYVSNRRNHKYKNKIPTTNKADLNTSGIRTTAYARQVHHTRKCESPIKAKKLAEPTNNLISIRQYDK